MFPVTAGDVSERLISSLERDLQFMLLSKPNLGSRLRLVCAKYRMHLTELLGRPVKPWFLFLGRAYHVSSYTDGALLQRVLLDTHSALASLGLLGAPGLRAVDVGAHNGETVLAWSLYLDRPAIQAFEPDAVSLRNAAVNTRGLLATLRGVGLSDRSGVEGLDVHQGHGGAATYVQGAHDLPNLIQTTVARGDDLLAGKDVDLIKIDVEGYERHVLEGLRATLQRCRFLVVEVSLQRPKDHAFHELAGILAEARYELMAASRPHAAGDGRQVAIDLCFRRTL